MFVEGERLYYFDWKFKCRFLLKEMSTQCEYKIQMKSSLGSIFMK